MVKTPLEEPHKLTLAQLKALDVYSYWSPKLSRDVMCIGLTAYRLGVWLEAQPQVSTYAERPWGLSRQGHEADFIALHTSGEIDTRVIHSFVRQRKGNSEDALDAENTGFSNSKQASLEWFDDRSNAHLRVEVDNLIRMLPYVVLHSRRANSLIETSILELVDQGRRTIAQIEAEISGEKTAVNGAIFALHFKGTIKVDLATDLNRTTLVGITT